MDLNKLVKDKVVGEVFDKEKVLLTCGKHKWAYGDKRMPTPGCRDCQLASFVGLLAHTPKDKWLEVVEMLEHSVHHLIEQDEKGLLAKEEFMQRPEIWINDKKVS